MTAIICQETVILWINRDDSVAGLRGAIGSQLELCTSINHQADIRAMQPLWIMIITAFGYSQSQHLVILGRATGYIYK